MSLTLARAVSKGLETGEPLPTAFQALEDLDVNFYRGGVTIVAGVPGAMKTMFLLNLAVELKIPTLYLSNDSNEATIASRLLARKLGEDSKLMRERLLAEPEWAAAELAGLDWIRWSFDPSPSLKDIEEEMLAFEEIYGEMPHLVVVDVLMKVNYAEKDNERGTHERIIQYLDILARNHAAAVVVAAHTSEGEAGKPEKGSPVQPQSALMFKVGQLIVMQLHVAYRPGVFYICPVKNRDGFSDTTGRTYVRLKMDPTTSTMEDW